MITGFFLQLIFWLANALIGILPNATPLPSDFADGVSLIMAKLSAFSWLFPIYSLINAVIFVALFDLTILGFKLALWVLKLIRPH